MTEQDRQIADDRALWLSVGRSWAEHGLGEEPGPMTLAAFLDDRLEPADRARVEAWMAAAPEGLDLVVAARLAAQAGSAPAPRCSQPWAWEKPRSSRIASPSSLWCSSRR